MTTTRVKSKGTHFENTNASTVPTIIADLENVIQDGASAFLQPTFPSVYLITEEDKLPNLIKICSSRAFCKKGRADIS
jgi:hypothetical protein